MLIVIVWLYLLYICNVPNVTWLLSVYNLVRLLVFQLLVTFGDFPSTENAANTVSTLRPRYRAGVMARVVGENQVRVALRLWKLHRQGTKPFSFFFYRMYFSCQRTPLIPAQASQAHWMRVRIQYYWRCIFIQHSTVKSKHVICGMHCIIITINTQVKKKIKDIMVMNFVVILCKYYAICMSRVE